MCNPPSNHEDAITIRSYKPFRQPLSVSAVETQLLSSRTTRGKRIASRKELSDAAEVCLRNGDFDSRIGGPNPPPGTVSFGDDCCVVTNRHERRLSPEQIASTCPTENIHRWILDDEDAAAEGLSAATAAEVTDHPPTR